MNWRFRFVFFCIVISFFLIVLRLFYWQVVRAEELSSVAQSQYGRVANLLPERGEIQTSDLYPIAANKLSYLVFANPKEIKDKNTAIPLLSSLLEIDKATISAQLQKDLFWVPLKPGIPTDKKEELEKLKLPGIGFEEQYTRFYPEASMAAHLLGFVGKDDYGQDKGYFGIEGFYDRQLRGKAGRAVQIHDALGRPILAKLNNSSGQVNGRTLVLHVDRAIQFLVERKLKEAVEQYQASGGAVAIMDPKTGGILAISSVPSFDPRKFADFSGDVYRNPVVSNAYEPGSTFKAIVMAAALDKGAVKPETQCFECGAPVEIGGYSIKTWNNEYKAGINMIETIQHSDNTGMVFAGKKLGFDNLLEYFDRFGIGQTTGIDVQGEVAPALRPKNAWYPIDIATASFGQGISVTAIELLDAFASLANNGKRMEPHVVSKVITAEGQTISIDPKVLSTTVSDSTTKVMTEILVNAVDEGEAKFAKPKGYRIAGKTGTAQIPIAGHYDPNKTIASFIGFAPADDPKFVMLVIIDKPTTSIYGAETAAPLFFDIAKNLFAYYKISPKE
jgi:stage V sporulation protein D (sporulation-specific penicillin-binding protein)